MEFLYFIILIMFGWTIDESDLTKFIVIPKNMTVNSGDNVVLECTTDQMPLYYSWEYKQMKTISTILGFCYSGKTCVIQNWASQIRITNQSKLIIYNVTARNSGKYVCESSSSLDQITVSAEITVKTPPNVIRINFNRSTNTFQENEFVSIHCSVSGAIPQPKILISVVSKHKVDELKATFDSSQHGESAEVTATSLWRPNFSQHEGFVMCTAINEAGNLTKKSSMLNIKYEPKIKSFSTSIIKAIINQTIDLTCDVTANPPATVQWIIMNGVQKIDSSELITKIKPDMAGTLTCKAKNSSGSRSKSIKLVVLRDPVISLKSIYRIREYSDYSITCVVDSEPSPDFIKWYKLSNISDPAPVLISNDAKLNFVRTDRQSSGIYACFTQNTQTPTMGNKRIANSEKMIHLIVMYKPGEPRIVNENSITILKGDPFQLKCSFNEKNPGEPLPNLEWIDTESRNIISETYLFEVKKSNSNHNGRFQCIAKNEMGSTLSVEIATVTVHESPSLISDSANNKVFLSYPLLPQSIDFTCTFRGQPLYESKWRYGNDVILSSSEDYKIEVFRNQSTDRATLVFSKLTINLNSPRYSHQTSALVSPNGRYNCEASNILGISSVDYFLIIKYPPFFKMDIYHSKIAASINQNYVTIRCDFESVSNVYINWFKTNDHMSLSSKRRKYNIVTKDISKYDPSVDLFAPGLRSSELTIRDLELGDFTNYSCVATNEQGIKKINFEVVFKSQPEPPRDFKVQHIEWDSVTISWLPGFNGGFEQTFEIQVSSEHFGTQTVPYYSKKVENTLTITGLYPGIHYEMKIFAINSLGRSSSSPLVQCVTERIHKFDKIEAKILHDLPKIAVIVQEIDLYANLEYTRNNGRQWFSILHSIRFNASYINKTVLLDVGHVASILDLQSNLIHLRLTFCLLNRPDVCSSPKVLENPKKENLTAQTVILVIAIICFILIIILMALFIVCCVQLGYNCRLCYKYFGCGCCISSLYDTKLDNNRHYNDRKSFKGKSCNRVSFDDNLHEIEITKYSTSNYCSSLIGSATPQLIKQEYPPHSSNEIINSSFICPHHEFRSQISTTYGGSSFLQPTGLSWSQKTSPLSCEASSSHSQSSTGSSGNIIPQNQILYRKTLDIISNNSIIESYAKNEEHIKLPDVTSEAIHFVKPPFDDDKIVEAVV